MPDDQVREALIEKVAENISVQDVWVDWGKASERLRVRWRAMAVAALAVREEPQACTCRHPPEGMIGWDRGMVDRECPVHGHEALPERPDPQIEKVIEAVQGAREWTLLSGRPAYASPSVAPPGPELPNPGESVRVIEAEPVEPCETCGGSGFVVRDTKQEHKR